MNPKKILMIAGEASGDLHGAHLLEALRRIKPDILCHGVGGEKLERAGMRILFPSHLLSVMGIIEILPKMGTILKALRMIRQSLEKERPDLVILIDFPDFNLRVARHAHRLGVPVYYYISPQVWAWRSGRVRQIRQWVRKVLVFFPFEVPIYEKAGVAVEWVGHPLLDIVKPNLPREEALKRFALNPVRPTLGLLPGSRMGEVKRLLPTLLGAAEILHREIPSLQFLLPLASSLSRSVLSPLIGNPPFPLVLVEGQPYEAMNASDLLITASGTATLEGAILGKPMVIVYKVSALSYWIGRALIHVDHIGLVNLVGGRRIVPELIQDEANPSRIAGESLRFLKNPDLLERTKEAMSEVRTRLGTPGAADRAALTISSFLASPPGMGAY